MAGDLYLVPGIYTVLYTYIYSYSLYISKHILLGGGLLITLMSWFSLSYLLYWYYLFRRGYILKMCDYPYLIIFLFKSIYLVCKVVSDMYTVRYVCPYSLCIFYTKHIFSGGGVGFIDEASWCLELWINYCIIFKEKMCTLEYIICRKCVITLAWFHVRSIYSSFRWEDKCWK